MSKISTFLSVHRPSSYATAKALRGMSVSRRKDGLLPTKLNKHPYVCLNCGVLDLFHLSDNLQDSSNACLEITTCVRATGLS